MILHAFWLCVYLWVGGQEACVNIDLFLGTQNIRLYMYMCVELYFSGCLGSGDVRETGRREGESGKEGEGRERERGRGGERDRQRA